MKAVAQRCFVKNVFIKISQNSQENTAVSLFFNKVRDSGLQLFWKRDWHRCFPVYFAKRLRTRFLTDHLWWLLLNIIVTFQNIQQNTQYITLMFLWVLLNMYLPARICVKRSRWYDKFILGSNIESWKCFSLTRDTILQY